MTRTNRFGASALWHDGAACLARKAPALPRAADLVIVGAGILGLTVARQAARQGRNVLVLDSRPIGTGASGVNGGQVIPGLKHDLEWLIANFGAERGQVAADFASGTTDAVFDLIADEGLDVPWQRNGWIFAAHTEEAFEAAGTRGRKLANAGAPVEVLDAPALAALTGTRGYRGGLLDRRAGLIQPFIFLSELARIAGEAGATIYSGCRACGTSRRGGDWIVATAAGEIRAQKVLVATNADADALVPGLARTILPLHSFQLATAPLPGDLSPSILPGGQGVSDSRRIVTYYRKSPDGRLVLGGRGTLGEPVSPQDWQHLVNGMIRLFPSVHGLPITHRWFGRVAMTLDYLPHIHEPEPGLVAVLGCNGRGIALMTALGGPVANYLLSADKTVLPFPISEIKPIPFHRFRHLGVVAVIAWYRMLDGLRR